MEARRLTRILRSGARRAAPPQAQPACAPPAFFAPIARWFAGTDPRLGGELDLAMLNDLAHRAALRTESGKALRFVDARGAPGGAYERIVDESGCVPTRTRGDGMLHDWFNALAWLSFPRSKARLNAVHASALAGAMADEAAHASDAARPVPIGGRGRVRDAATLFDESGAIFAYRDQRLRDAFFARDWKMLFVHERDAFVRDVRIVVFGHALFEKLLDPYKAICAQAIALPVHGSVDAAAIDAMLVAHLRADALAAGLLHPLPLLGVPGWCEANEDPAFYDDARVFRSERRAHPRRA